jgi:hypothetical protein
MLSLLVTSFMAMLSKRCSHVYMIYDLLFM